MLALGRIYLSKFLSCLFCFHSGLHHVHYVSNGVLLLLISNSKRGRPGWWSSLCL